MSEAAPPDDLDFSEALFRLGRWCRREPVSALLLAGVLGVLFYFFGAYRVFMNGAQTTAEWAWRSWNAENDLEHGCIILPAALFMVWWHRGALAAAPKSSSLAGLAIALVGVALFVFAVRTLQPRVAILALPVLCYGSVRYLWGAATARVMLFPCAFLLFMMPLGFLVSRTVGLQTLTATVAARLSQLIGIGVEADGARLWALDGSFQFEVAGGCSGIRSLTAMTMLAALFVHFTQDLFWKKGLIFGSSLLFALLGNLVRIFTVVLFARFISPQIAAGLYHDWSGFIFFPIAVGAMASFASLVNRDWNHSFQTPAPAQPWPAAPVAPPPASRLPAPKPAGPISYDY